VNQVSIYGRLTRDPELRYTQQGKAVANFSLAVNRFNDNEADFFDCEAWEKQAENIANSCKKGHRLLIWGRLRQDRWTDQQTQQNRTAVRIVVQGFSFIEPPPPPQGQAPPQGPGGYQGQPLYQQPGYPGYVPPPGGYPPPYPGQYPQQQQAGKYRQGPPPGPPPVGYPPAGAPAAPGQFGQFPGFSGNLDDIDVPF